MQPYAWETGLAAQFLTGDEVLARLVYAAYFDLSGQPLPDNRQGIFDKLKADHLVQADVGGHWSITNLGAILLAKRLADFSPSMARKAIRFVAYDGLNRSDTVTHRQDGQKGYAIGFTGLIDFMDGLMPRNEFIGKAFREERPLYPAIAIRELVANALIHQDMTVTGAGPLVEMFSDRLEITNPGQPLVKPERFLDFPPRSRNEAQASLMRRMRLCEEQDTGIDKVIVAEPDDIESGTIYVLRSLSSHPFVTEQRELIHKIGVTGGSVETRIAGAEKDATYLLVGVEVVAVYKLHNLNRTRMVNIFHRLFGAAQLDFTIEDRFGNPVKPREWFLVPLQVIDEAVQRIRDGSITDVVYDPNAAWLVG